MFYDTESGRSVKAKEGEEFTLTFNDVTLYERLSTPEGGKNFGIRFDISYGILTFNKITDLGPNIDGLIIPTDWSGHRPNLEEELKKFDESTDFDEISLYTIDTEYGFGLKIDIIDTLDSKQSITSKIVISHEIRYEKETGVLTYERNYSKSTISDNIIEQERIIQPKGFSTPELRISAPSLPCFLQHLFS